MTRADRRSAPPAIVLIAVLAALAATGLAGCTGDKLPVAQLQDPSTCKDCHPKHFEQWSGSMHAYASDDPVFLAMNRRGQRETGGKLGDFCINCHAPMAKQFGLADGASFDPEALPPAARGITCYFCHNVDRLTRTHDNGLELANDQTMRGGVTDPVDTSAHHSKYDQRMDSNLNQSEMCGSCHDIVVPASINGSHDVAIERTFVEWQGTFFASTDKQGLHLTCGDCHMIGSRLEAIADAPGVKARLSGFHDHGFPGIDLALTPFPQQAEQATAVQSILDPSIRLIGPVATGTMQPTGGICVLPSGEITVRVDSIGTGHSWPSGAAQDRRAWLEVIAYDDQNNVLFQSGVVPPGMDPEIVEPGVFGFWDRALKADGTPAHFFWDVDRFADCAPSGCQLHAPAVPKMDVSRTARFPVGGVQASITRVTARFRFNPLPYAMLDSLIASGDLAPEIRDRMKTLEVSKPTVWLRSTSDPTTRCNVP
ncbi:MAG TPA: multiheme c-type cytochrome [Kofleriaceae bacterium]|nr:multiheme c-type cytochrome [Kofleriaceae bacterium]